MIKIPIAITSLMLFAANSYSLECGDYYAQATIKEKNNSLYVVVNEKSKSEINLEAINDIETKLAPYQNRPVSVKLSINKAFVGSESELSGIDIIELRAANPAMGARDSYIKQLKKYECKKWK